MCGYQRRRIHIIPVLIISPAEKRSRVSFHLLRTCALIAGKDEPALRHSLLGNRCLPQNINFAYVKHSVVQWSGAKDVLLRLLNGWRMMGIPEAATHAHTLILKHTSGGNMPRICRSCCTSLSLPHEDPFNPLPSFLSQLLTSCREGEYTSRPLE